MKTSDVLYDAADLIDERGWWTVGAPETGTGSPLCAGNAIFAVLKLGRCTPRQMLDGQRAFADHLGDQADGVSFLSRIWNWNDEPDRTADEVTAALRAAALIEAAREETEARILAGERPTPPEPRALAYLRPGAAEVGA